MNLLAIVGIGLVIINLKLLIFSQIPKYKNSNGQIQDVEVINSPTVLPTPTVEPIRSVILEVPFVSQAPTAEWNDATFQDGCEEAATLMAYAKLKDIKFDKNSARDEIVKMAEWQRVKYGTAVDTSAADTGQRLLGQYLNINYLMANIETKEEIIRELMKGNVVIVPTDGRKLKNPNFKNGGPERHMVVVRGFDLETREFITNDPGTRLGENYRYQERVLFEAIRDYVTGDHELIINQEKRMIVILI